MMYKSGAVSAASGVSQPMLGRWQDRKTVKPSRHDKASTGSGDHALFSRDSVIKIAITKTLTTLGITSARASKAAALFTGLNPLGRTLLLVTPNGARILNVEFNAALDDICPRPFHAVVVDIGPIAVQVDNVLSTQKAVTK